MRLDEFTNKVAGLSISSLYEKTSNRTEQEPVLRRTRRVLDSKIHNVYYTKSSLHQSQGIVNHVCNASSLEFLHSNLSSLLSSLSLGRQTPNKSP